MTYLLNMLTFTPLSGTTLPGTSLSDSIYSSTFYLTLLIIWALGFLGFFVLGATAPEGYRKQGARIMIFSAVWPIALLYALWILRDFFQEVWAEAFPKKIRLEFAPPTGNKFPYNEFPYSAFSNDPEVRVENFVFERFLRGDLTTLYRAEIRTPHEVGKLIILKDHSTGRSLIMRVEKHDYEPQHYFNHVYKLSGPINPPSEYHLVESRLAETPLGISSSAPNKGSST